MKENKRFLAGNYVPKIIINDRQLIYNFGGEVSGESKDVLIDEVETPQTEYKETLYVYWYAEDEIDIEDAKARFIQEYLENKGCGINEQIAAMANGGEDLVAYQALREDAKAAAAGFLVAWDEYLSSLEVKVAE